MGIPLVTDKQCNIPPNLSIYSKMKFAPNNKLFNFWERLVKTINPAIKYDETKLINKPEASASASAIASASATASASTSAVSAVKKPEEKKDQTSKTSFPVGK